MNNQTSKKLFIVFSFLLTISFSSIAQEDIDPVKWSVELINEHSDSTQIVAHASIEDGWHVYSQVISDDPEAMGPMPLEFITETSDYYLLRGKPLEKSKMITHYDKAFEIDLNYYENDLVVVQPIEILSKKGFVKGSILYMACDDEKCIFPPEFIFELKIK